MEAPSAEVRQYGGGYGGFVECCEGVVDPLFLLLIIAGGTRCQSGDGCEMCKYLHIHKDFNIKEEDTLKFLFGINLNWA